MQMADVGGLFSMPGCYQVAESITAMDVSSSGELVAFGDHQGALYLWADKGAMDRAVAANKTSVSDSSDSSPPLSVNPNGISMQTSIPERQAPPPPASRWADDTCLSAAPFPHPSTHLAPLLSDWPPMAIGPARAPLIIEKTDPFVASVTGKDFVGYAGNPGFKRGQTHKGLSWLRKVQNPSWGKTTDGETGMRSGEGEGDGAESSKAKTLKKQRWREIANDYQLQEIKLGKLGIEDFPFAKFNKTAFGGLENTIPNSYINAWIHTMLFNAPLRTRVLCYLSAKEVSLTDELGFLFHMLVNSRGQCCQATNFLRAFAQLPEASRLELLDQTTATAFVAREGSDKEILRRVQNLNRFVLEQMNKEMCGKEAHQQSAIDLVFGASMLRKETVLTNAGAEQGSGIRPPRYIRPPRLAPDLCSRGPSKDQVYALHVIYALHALQPIFARGGRARIGYTPSTPCTRAKAYPIEYWCWVYLRPPRVPNRVLVLGIPQAASGTQ
jgi:PAB-dependent poly(A)-specific ribonuclease subunit 2